MTEKTYTTAQASRIKGCKRQYLPRLIRTYGVIVDRSNPRKHTITASELAKIPAKNKRRIGVKYTS